VAAPIPPRAPILVLPPRAAERIAAGEVVERPASVVKELVENALDAGARQVRVEVRGGGLRLVRVVDDGCGIPPGEIPLAFQRHATSKIRGVDDLERLATLGFRGEALPSIAAVAEVVMLTAADDGGLGQEALVRNGAVVALTPRPRTRGTTVSVRYLFQTVPARLKFVANARGEVAAIGALLRRYALAYPDVRFTLLVEGRIALRTSGGGLAATLAEVHGAAVAEALRPLPSREVAGARLSGYLGERHVTRPNRGGITLVVNRRLVETRELLAALEAAYRPLLPRGRHPVALLCCDLPPQAVDVNVHPAKTEVKFWRGRELAEGLAAWVREALGRTAAQPPADADLGWVVERGDLNPPLARPDAGAEGIDEAGREGVGAARAEGAGAVGGGAAGAVVGEGIGAAGVGLLGGLSAGYALGDTSLAWRRIAEGPSPPAPLPGREGSKQPAAGGEHSEALPLRASEGSAGLPLPVGEGWGEGVGSLPPLRLVEQVQETLLLCEGPAGLYLVDQHRAHERVLYERLRARHAPAAPAAVEPLVLELRPAQAQRLATRLPALAALGFVCEWFGGRSFLVRATPALPSGATLPAAGALGAALDDLLAEAATEEDDWQDRLLISVACHGALRRGQPLDRNGQRALLAALDRTAAPAVCPHGSPLILHLSAPFLTRQFRWR